MHRKTFGICKTTETTLLLQHRDEIENEVEDEESQLYK
jgi:hypothetical protein